MITEARCFCMLCYSVLQLVESIMQQCWHFHVFSLALLIRMHLSVQEELFRFLSVAIW